jgi:hypothetical protein
MDFDRSRGLFSNYKRYKILDTSQAGIGSLCFSPDSRFIYVSTVVDLFQYDLSSPDLIQSEVHIAHSKGTICDPALNRKATFGTMALGPDCRIYLVSRFQQACMNVILYPNKKGKDCSFI